MPADNEVRAIIERWARAVSAAAHHLFSTQEGRFVGQK